MKSRQPIFEWLEPRYLLAAQISGAVWQDVDADGVREAGEPGHAGIAVYLDLNRNGQRDPDEPTKLTAADDSNTPANEAGTYLFTGLSSGDYDVRIDLPEGISQTTQLATSWPDSTSHERLYSHGAERLLGFGELVAASDERFAVASLLPLDANIDGHLVSIYRTIGDEVFLEAELPIPHGPGGYDGVFSLALEDNLLFVGLAGQSVNGVTLAGEVLVYRRTENTWNWETRLTAPDAADSDSLLFGTGLALHGNLAVIGAIGDDTVSGNAGAAYVFERTDAGWNLRQKLLGIAGIYCQEFGLNLAIDNESIIVGVPQHARPSGASYGSGVVYVFDRQDDNWSRTAILEPPANSGVLELGDSVAIRDDLLVAGGPGHYGSEAIVYRRVDGVWSAEAVLTGNSSDEDFGDSVAIVGDQVLVAEPFLNAPHTWSGAVFVFGQQNGIWARQEQLTRGTPGPPFFGRVLAATGDALIVGQVGDSTLAYSAGVVHVIRPTVAPGAIRLAAPLSGGVIADDIGIALQPSAPKLAFDDDTGISHTDRITSRNNVDSGSRLAFDVTGVSPGAAVELYIDDQLAATGLAGAAGARLLTDGITQIADGAHSVIAVIRHVGGSASLASEPTAIVIDSRAPTLDFEPLTTAANSPVLHPLADENTHTLVLEIAGQVIDAQWTNDEWTVPAGALQPLSPGTYDVTVGAADAAGNESHLIIASGLTIARKGMINGRVFDDANGNGLRDADEPGMPGVTVFIDRDGDARLDPAELRQVTQADDLATPNIDESGSYAFSGIIEGNYVIRILPPPGREITAPGTDHEAWAGAAQSDTITLRRPVMYESLGRTLDTDENVLAAGATFYSAFITKDGAVIFDRDDPFSPWREALVIDSTDVDVVYGSAFGFAVAVGDSFVAVGAPGDHIGTADYSGSIHLFERDGISQHWTYTAKLTMPEPERLARFGAALAAEGNRIVVAAPRAYGFALNGSAYIFELHVSPENEHQWVVAAEFASLAPDWTPDFGSAVALSGDLVAISSPNESATGVVYLYQRTSGPPPGWQLAYVLHPEPGLNRFQFGTELELQDDLLIVRSLQGLDIYDLSALASAGPRYIPTDLPDLYNGQFDAVSISAQTLIVSDPSFSEPRVEVWRRPTVDSDTWFRVNQLPRLIPSVATVSGDQLIYGQILSDQVPEYAGELSIFDAGEPTASQRLSLLPGASAADAAFGLFTPQAPNLPGDFNDDGAVDAADFVIWRASQDSFLPQYSGADANGDRRVDAADRAIWQAHFGRQLLATGAASPSTPVLLSTPVPITEFEIGAATVAHRLTVDSRLPALPWHTLDDVVVARPATPRRPQLASSGAFESFGNSRLLLLAHRSTDAAMEIPIASHAAPNRAPATPPFSRLSSSTHALDAALSDSLLRPAVALP